MKFFAYVRFVGLIAAFLVVPALASAQDSIKCESNDGRRNYCGSYDYRQVRLERQISGSPCVSGQSWGVDRQGLWVDSGCRAIFTVRDPRGDRDRDGDGDDSRNQDSITCESNNGRRNYCGSYDYRQVRLDKQISGSPCVSGQSWGVDGRGLWVDNGCRAIFSVRTHPHGDGYGHHGDDNGGNQDSIRCESNDGRRNYCGNYDYDRVRLDRQISDSPCVNGRSWGVDDRGLWVDNGCRAFFTVEARPRHRENGGNSDYGGIYGGYSNKGWWDPDPNDSWPPRGEWRGGKWASGGACFYQDREFRGSYFCMRRGEQREELGGYGDQISSMRTFGGARVTIYDDRDFRGARETVSGDRPELQQLRVSQKPGHTWNDRISSIQIQ